MPRNVPLEKTIWKNEHRVGSGIIRRLAVLGSIALRATGEAPMVRGRVRRRLALQSQLDPLYAVQDVFGGAEGWARGVFGAQDLGGQHGEVARGAARGVVVDQAGEVGVAVGGIELEREIEKVG